MSGYDYARQAYANRRLSEWRESNTRASFTELLAAFRSFGEDFDAVEPSRALGGSQPVTPPILRLRKWSNGEEYEGRPLSISRGRPACPEKPRGEYLRIRRVGARHWATYHRNVAVNEFEWLSEGEKQA